MAEWALASTNPRHETQAKEFLDFLEAVYGRDFAWANAQKAIRIAERSGDSEVRVAYVYEAPGIPMPEYVRENHAYFLSHGRENLETSGRQLMAGRLRAWVEKWDS